MGRKRINGGLYVSIALHVIIMIIPVTMRLAQESDEIEFYITDEKPKVSSVSTRPIPPASEKKRVMNKMVIEQPERVMEKHQEETNETIKSPIAVETLVPSPKEVFEEPPKPQAIPLSSPMKKSSIVQSGVRAEEAGSQTSSWKQTFPPSNEMGFGSKEGPRFLRQEMPTYPLMARRLGKEGKVILRLTIDEKGNLLNAEVLEGAGFGFTEAAVEAVKRSKFLPAKKEGKPVLSKAILPVRFTLRRSE
jgi:protein TonB